MNKLVLITTVHNLNINENDLKCILNKLPSIFFKKYISISNTTSAKLKSIFANSNDAECIFIQPKGAADARRRILTYAYSRIKSNYFYCDFDKVVVAILEKEKVFKEYIRNSDYIDGYVIIGRNNYSFLSYPKTWQDTESITNKVASVLFDIKNIDITSGCCAFSTIAAKLILKKSKERLTDTEWPILCKNKGYKISYSEVAFLIFKSKFNSGKNDNNWKGYIPRLKLTLRALESFDRWQNN